MTMPTTKAREPEDMFRDALELMGDAYRRHVKACADGIEERVREDGDGFDFSQILHEDIDGDAWVIWTQKAQAVCLVSANSGYSAEQYGVETVVKDGEIDWSAMAFGALSEDVCEELRSRDRDLNADTVAKFFGEEEDEDEDASPACDHGDGCEQMARWQGKDEAGKVVATFCEKHHRESLETDNEPADVVVWEVL